MILQSNIDSITIIRILKERIGEVEARKVYGIITAKVNLIVGLPLALNGAISISLIPEIAKNMIKRDYPRLERNINLSIFITLMIAVPTMVFTFQYANEIIRFLYPNAPKGAKLLKLASFTIVFSCVTQNISGILQGIGNSRTHLYAVIIGMLLKLFFNILLISNARILERGAMISTVITDIFIFLVMYYQLKKSFSISFSIGGKFIKMFLLSNIGIFITETVCLRIPLGVRRQFILEAMTFILVFLLLASPLIKGQWKAIKKHKNHKSLERLDS